MSEIPDGCECVERETTIGGGTRCVTCGKVFPATRIRVTGGTLRRVSSTEQIAALRARIQELERVIAEAPHDPVCASREHLNSYYADHPRPPCDCFKSKASVR